MYLLDTNIVSELRRPSCHGAVKLWRTSVERRLIALPAVVMGELQSGVEAARRQDRHKALELEQWLDRVAAAYEVIPMDGETFREWARLMNGRSADLLQDAMIAATARIHHLVVVTRNTKDFDPFEVEVLNPFLFNGGNQS